MVYDGDQYCTIGPDTPPVGSGGSWSYIGTCSGSYPLPSDTPPVTPTPSITPSVTPEPSISTTPDVSITPSPSSIPACRTYGLDWQEVADREWAINADYTNCSDGPGKVEGTSGPGPDPGQVIFCAREGSVIVNVGINLMDLGPC